MDANAAAVGVTPVEFSRLFPSRHVLSSEGDAWRHITLQRHVVSPGRAEIPPTQGHRFVLHLEGTALFDGTYEGRRVRRWSAGGQSYIWPAGASLERELAGHADGIIVHVAPAFIDAAALQAFDRDPSRMTVIERVGITDPVLEQLGRLLLHEAESEMGGARLMVETLATSLAVQLLRRHSNLAPRLPLGAAGLPGGRLRCVIDYMRANLEEDVSLTRLAGVAGLSPAQFVRGFRAATGESPHRYLVGLRVERARELLEGTELPVIEVGLRCGFGQPSHFATTFRKSTGFSPSRWRAIRRW